MGNKLDDDTNENSLAYAKNFKKYLRFDVGDIVYLKSDIKKRCPMQVKKILILDDDDDYTCIWATAQKNIERGFFTDKLLTT
jgi:hypothetical protein